MSRAAQPFIVTLDNAPKEHNAQRVKRERVSPHLQTARAGVWAVTQLTGAFCRLRRKGTGSPAPPQRGAPLTLRAAPTGAANSLPPAGAERGAQGSPNCAKAVFCAPLRGLQLALFGGCDLARPRPAAARCLPAEKGELRQIPTFAPPLRGFTIRAELSRDRAAMAANLQQLAFVERGRLPL